MVHNGDHILIPTERRHRHRWHHRHGHRHHHHHHHRRRRGALTPSTSATTPAAVAPEATEALDVAGELAVEAVVENAAVPEAAALGAVAEVRDLAAAECEVAPLHHHHRRRGRRRLRQEDLLVLVIALLFLPRFLCHSRS